MQHPTANNTSMKLALVALILLVGLLLVGCSGAGKYQVDYCGAKGCYSNAKDSYRAGSEVTLYFELVATDTDYSFLLDGEPVHYTYDDQKGFVIQFTMPDHDVKLEYNAYNSMLPMVEDGSAPGIVSGAGLMGIGNPVAESTLEELAEETGYTLTLPEETFQDLSVTRITGAVPLYTVEFRSSEDDNYYTFRLKKDPTAGDISGMYYTWTIHDVTEDYEMHLTRNGQGIILWQDDEASFSISMEENASSFALLEMRECLLAA